MIRIGIIEIKCANHMVADLCRFCDPKNNHVTLYTTQKLLPQIKQDLAEYLQFVKITIKRERETYFAFLGRVKKECNEESDLVVINTLRRWEFVFFRPKCKVLGYVYNVNFWIRDLKTPKVILSNMMKLCCGNYLSWLPSKIHANPLFGPVIRILIMRNLDGVLVEYPTFTKIINQKYRFNKPAFFLPNRYFKQNKIITTNEQITFVITGMISKKRRNYDIVLDALIEIPKNIRPKIKLILLGQPVGEYGCQIVERCKKLVEFGFTIQIPEGFIPHETFMKDLLFSDIIISPIQLNYKSLTVSEKLTYTKGTGTFSDALQFGKPSIVPEEYNVAPEFKSCFIKYKDKADLCQIISELALNKNKIHKLKQETITVMKNYSLNKVQKMFQNIIMDMDIN